MHHFFCFLLYSARSCIANVSLLMPNYCRLVCIPFGNSTTTSYSGKFKLVLLFRLLFLVKILNDISSTIFSTNNCGIQQNYTYYLSAFPHYPPGLEDYLHQNTRPRVQNIDLVFGHKYRMCFYCGISIFPLKMFQVPVKPTQYVICPTKLRMSPIC